MTILLVAGISNSGTGHWQTFWADRLPKAQRVQQGDWEQPRLESWLHALTAAVLRNPGSILVGHSLGAVLIAHMLNRNPGLPVAGVLLVAPADTDADTLIAARLRERTANSFGPMPLSPLPCPAILVGSRNDPFMSFERARTVASMWEAVFVDAGSAGHINVESGHGRWPEGDALLVRLQRLVDLETEATTARVDVASSNFPRSRSTQPIDLARVPRKTAVELSAISAK